MLGPRLPSLAALAVLAIAIVVLVADGAGDGDSAGGESAGEEGKARIEATVTRVVDGDTVEAALPDGEEEDVRYIGIDTPESVAPGQPVECFGERASHANEELVDGEQVVLVFDDERRDQYGRLLAYVYVRGLFVNAELVREGLARTLTISPNTDHAELFDRLEQNAGNAGLGLWGACDP